MSKRLDKIRTILEFKVSKGKGVAAILAKKHDRLAQKHVYGDHKTWSRHERAATRFARVASGKKPFSESKVHGRFKIGDKITTRLGKQISGKIESLDGNYVHFRNPDQNEKNAKGKLYRTHLANIKFQSKEDADKRKKSSRKK